ncbi:MAG TPA: GNAT family N-acetyltransferase [Kofleriaceae bacterium]|jgi:L-amino acid N-acyltransferase YncA|nr:GNAT family N-acetyltransferase [Kofleriaceae bacterium]
MSQIALEPAEPVALRLARPQDCEAIWCWNFAPDVRAQSRQGEAVAFIEHARWYARRLADGDAPIWVIEEYHQGIGVVRLDPPQPWPPARRRARISIALATSARGRGIGRAAVAAACHAWRQPIVAEIFADNAASRACFEACGFRAIAACDGLVFYHWDPEA